MYINGDAGQLPPTPHTGRLELQPISGATATEMKYTPPLGDGAVSRALATVQSFTPSLAIRDNFEFKHKTGGNKQWANFTLCGRRPQLTSTR